MKVSEIKKYKRDIAIILQTERYKGKKVDEELIHSILADLELSTQDIDEVLKELNKPKGSGTYII
jgi:hypothetical protein